jgi:O-glycosyl hydrolase
MFISRSGIISAVVFLFTASAAQLFSATISLTESVEYQTIDGFGAYGGKMPYFKSGPYYDDAFVNLVVNDLGLTILRMNIAPSDNAESNLGMWVPYIKAVSAKITANGDQLKLIGSVWTPPTQFKVCNCTNTSLNDTSNNRFIQANNGAYGDYLVSFMGKVKSLCGNGIKLYAVSPQNEPAFAEGYASCYFNAGDLRNTIKVIGP